jgi:hypothetical protein
MQAGLKMSGTTGSREIPRSKRRFTPNRFLAVFLLLVSLLLTVWLIPRYVSGYTTGTHGLSPRFFPYLITLVLTGLSLLLLAKDLARPEDTVSRKEDKRITKATGLTMSILIGYYILIRLIGMIPASVAANIFLVRLFGFQRWKAILIFSVFLILILFLFFEKIAQVPMPRGLLFDGLY